MEIGQSKLEIMLQQYEAFLPAKKRTRQANPAGKNSLFIFAVCIKSVPFYYFKLVYVVPHTTVKEFFKPTSKN